VVGWDSDKLGPSALAEVRQIALLQKGVITMIACHLILIVAMQFVPPETRPILSWLYLLIAVGGVICTWLLAITLYGVLLGVLIALSTGIPCIGLVMLVVINGRATLELKEYGVPVHLFGVPWSAIPPKG